jgi:hypothetical protein
MAGSFRFPPSHVREDLRALRVPPLHLASLRLGRFFDSDLFRDREDDGLHGVHRETHPRRLAPRRTLVEQESCLLAREVSVLTDQRFSGFDGKGER